MSKRTRCGWCPAWCVDLDKHLAWSCKWTPLAVAVDARSRSPKPRGWDYECVNCDDTPTTLKSPICYRCAHLEKVPPSTVTRRRAKITKIPQTSGWLNRLLRYADEASRPRPGMRVLRGGSPAPSD